MSTQLESDLSALLRETGESLYALRDFAEAKSKHAEDLQIALALFAWTEIEMREVISKLTGERDTAIQERDHAREQLKAIGRKSFWAARP